MLPSSPVIPLLTLLLPSLSFATALDNPNSNVVQSSSHKHSSRSSRNVPEEGYFNPNSTGGSMLTKIPVTYPAGLGEPLNIIIDGLSDEDVLVDAEEKGGLLNLFLAWGFSGTCLGQQATSKQAADLGDGNGAKDEIAVMRWNYGDPELGSCTETIQGGNHFRYWIQNGGNANSGSIFLAASYEKPIAEGHDIIVNGYNLGRDWLVGNITKSEVPTRNLTNTTEYSAQSSYGGYTYDHQIKYVSGLLANTSEGVNHQYSVGTSDNNAMDGLVAVMTIKISARPQGSNGSWKTTPPRIWLLHVLGIFALSFPLML